MARFIIRRLIQMVGVVFVAVPAALLLAPFAARRCGVGDPRRAGHPRDLARALTEAFGLDQPVYVQYLKFLQRAARGEFGASTSVLPGPRRLRHLPDPAARHDRAEHLRDGRRRRASRSRSATWPRSDTARRSTTARSCCRSSASRCRCSSSRSCSSTGSPSTHRSSRCPVARTPPWAAPGSPASSCSTGCSPASSTARPTPCATSCCPPIALATIPFAVIFRITRASVLDVLDEDYVRTAESKGLTIQVIRARHVMRNALLPVITTIGLQTGGLLAGAVLTETVFNFGGIGSTLLPGLQRPRLRGAPGDHPGHGRDLRHRQPARRHLVRRHRPESAHPMTAREPAATRWTAASSGSTTWRRAAPARPRPARTASGSVLVVDDAGTVDEAPGVSLIASAWRRLRRDPVFLVGAGITLVFVVFAIISPWIAPHDPAAGLLLDKVRPQSNPIPGPEPGLPARRRRQGPRLALAPPRRQPADPHRRCPGHADRPDRRPGARHPRRRLRRRHRLVRHAGRRRAALDPVAAARRVDRGAGQPAQPVDGHHRHRGGADPGVRPPAARLDARPTLERPRAGRPGPRREAAAPSSSGTWCPTRSDRSSCRPPWCSRPRSSTPPRCPSSAWATPTTTPPSGARCSAGRRQYIYDNPHLAVYPALCIILVALGFTLMGESLREALDPKSRR